MDPAFPEVGHVLEPQCHRCPSLVADRTCIAWGNGPLDADIVVVGEAPAAGDPDAQTWMGGNLTGLAYTSRHSGRRIRTLLSEAGFTDRVYYTNAVKCFPRDRDAETKTNREPTTDELESCRRHLETELRTVHPAVVCPTGKHATESVLALVGAAVDRFLDVVLVPRATNLSGVETTVCPLLHPSYQDVWRARLGYEDGEYAAAVRKTLESIVEGDDERANDEREEDEGSGHEHANDDRGVPDDTGQA